MALVKSPTLTPAKLAANCSNACKSTGPNTPAGKRRVVLNALKHGRTSRAFGENLIKAGADAELFDWIRSPIFDGFQRRSVLERWQAEGIGSGEVWCRAWRALLSPWGIGGRAPQAPGAYRAPRQAGFERLAGMSRASVWCLAWTPWRLGGLETKPRYSLKSTDSSVTSPSRIQIVDPRNGRRLAFWVRRRRGTSPPRTPLMAYPEGAAWLLMQQPALMAARETADGGTGKTSKDDSLKLV